MAKFQKGQSGNPATMFKPGNTAGRTRRVRLSGIPKDARNQVYAALFHALSLPDKETAEQYLRAKAAELPEYGYLIQVYAKGMMGKFGYDVAEKVLDRLFGKPKQTTEAIIGTTARSAMQISLGTPEAVEGLRHALQTGAQPAPPADEQDND